MSFKKKIFLIMISATLAAVAVLIFLMKDDPEKWVKFVVNKDTHWVLFLGLMAVLPVFGFPISVFLVLSAVKFGFTLGALATALIIPLHLAGSWLLAKTFLYPHLEDFLNSTGYQLPRFPNDRTLLFTSLFVLIPGPPYFLKNYLLALSGIKFRYYFSINWSMELAICIPMVGLGESLADMNFGLAGLFAAIIAAGYLVSLRLKKRFSKTDT
jgi:uncharacterized membrane protein YdjX (TVP38/TMEM64 family)